jgi:hypothetical protein
MWSWIRRLVSSVGTTIKRFLQSVIYSFIVISLLIFALGFILVDSITRFIHEKFIK